MKYQNTWVAINAATEKSRGLTEYPTISQLVAYMRQYPHDVELLEWNLVCCAGNEMADNPKAPIWNEVLDIWHKEKNAERLNDWNKVNKVARQHKPTKEVV